MDSSDSIGLFMIVICLVLSAFFSASEAAFSSLNRMRLKNMADTGSKKAALALRLMDNYDNLQSTLLIGSSIFNVMLAVLLAQLGIRLLGSVRGLLLAILIAIFAVLIFVETIPKAISKEMPEKTAMSFASFTRVFLILFAPFSFLFKQLRRLLSSMFKSQSKAGITDDELLTILEEAEQGGGIDEQEGTLIRSAIEFMDLEAQDICTPRVDVIAVSCDATDDEIASTFQTSGFSRLPVYEEEIDHIVGTINIKDFYSFVYQKEGELATIIRTAFFISPTIKVGDLLKSFQSKNSHLAIILDEFGGTDGLITMEDIIEELVGEIWDEHDQVINEVEQVGNDEFIVLGSANAEKFFELFDCDYDYDQTTISGYIMAVMECVPQEGDTFTKDGFTFTVLKMEERRIEQIRIRKICA